MWVIASVRRRLRSTRTRRSWRGGGQPGGTENPAQKRLPQPSKSAGFRGPSGEYGKRVDTVGEVGSGGQGGEAGDAGGGTRGRAEPGGETLDVDRGRSGDVLEVRPGEPAVAAAAQPEGAHALRDGALDPGPPGV